MLSAWKKQVLFSFCILVLTRALTLAQAVDSLSAVEKQLLEQYNAILAEDVFKRSDKALEFYDSFCHALKNESSFNYPFAQLKNLGSIYSADQRIRIITWNIPAGYNDNLYFGIVQYYAKDDREYRIVRLNDKLRTGKDGILKDWEGALYYTVVETKHAGQRYYTLLGFDLYNPLSNKKVIDVFSIDDFDEFYTCEKLFDYQGKRLSRMSFEYNEKAIMSLQYNENSKMIVFDHLSPSRASLEGKFEFYGPDFTYDGLKWEKGVWVHYSNIDVTN